MHAGAGTPLRSTFGGGTSTTCWPAWVPTTRDSNPTTTWSWGVNWARSVPCPATPLSSRPGCPTQHSPSCSWSSSTAQSPPGPAVRPRWADSKVTTVRPRWVGCTLAAVRPRWDDSTEAAVQPRWDDSTEAAVRPRWDNSTIAAVRPKWDNSTIAAVRPRWDNSTIAAVRPRWDNSTITAVRPRWDDSTEV